MCARVTRPRMPNDTLCAFKLVNINFVGQLHVSVQHNPPEVPSRVVQVPLPLLVRRAIGLHSLFVYVKYFIQTYGF